MTLLPTVAMIGARDGTMELRVIEWRRAIKRVEKGQYLACKELQPTWPSSKKSDGRSPSDRGHVQSRCGGSPERVVERE